MCYTKCVSKEGLLMKYVVGYDHEGKFIVLYESNNLRAVLLRAKKAKAQRKEEIKIKKRA